MMRLLSLMPVLTAIARAQAPANESAVACPDGVGSDESYLSSAWRQLRAPARNDRHAAMIDKIEKRGSGGPFSQVSMQNNQCIDMKDGPRNGARLQVWQCTGGENQQWRIEGPLFQGSQNKCLDLPSGNAYNSAPLQVWDCDGNNVNQKWNRLGNALQWAGGGNWCVDLKDGSFYSGAQMQLWQCYPQSAHQTFKWSDSATAQQGDSTHATTYLGYAAISLDEFVSKYPSCAPYKAALQAAGSDVGINPTFLGSIAMIESGCNNFPGNQYGAFQWMDANAARYYVGEGKNIQNFWDAAYGAARYFKALLVQDGNNLYQAMRDYNGPISSGGEPRYQEIVANYMAGHS